MSLQKTNCAPIAKSKLLMLFRKKLGASCELYETKIWKTMAFFLTTNVTLFCGFRWALIG